MIRIGVTGHSDLTAPSLHLVKAVLRRWLEARSSAPWAGVSCLASGADQLFADLVVDLGGRLEVVLPAADYRTRKVEPDNVAEFDRLLAAAAAVRVLDFDRSSRHAYMAASAALLDDVDVLVAVWDGQPALRLGSTGDVVAEARRLGLPVSVLWPLGAARRPPTPPQPARQPVNVLGGLAFPAQRGEIVMFAEGHGADWHTRQQLVDLPDGTYPTVAAVAIALARTAVASRPGD